MARHLRLVSSFLYIMNSRTVYAKLQELVSIKVKRSFGAAGIGIDTLCLLFNCTESVLTPILNELKNDDLITIQRRTPDSTRRSKIAVTYVSLKSQVVSGTET
ncbi:MAG TPA: hypothetical protein VGE58_00015 [Daejeonella sp.]